jgi:polynucleotide 5'-kinase involved in rRNA processing
LNKNKLNLKKSNESIINIPVIPPKTASREERKEFLQESANKYLEAIEMQIGDLKKVGKNALVIGGVVLTAYALTELLLPSAKQKISLEPKLIEQEEDNNDENSIVWAALKGVATSVLLAVAKNKLLGIIDNFTTDATENVETNS